MLFESVEEATVRTVYDETGIELDRGALLRTHAWTEAPPMFWWRPRVDYFVAEVPYDTPVLGPQSNVRSYLREWDPRLMRQASDPIDRAWATLADPQTGCAWVPAAMIDQLQAPLKGANYMGTRYTPAPESSLHKLLVSQFPSVSATA
jgi:hypothetical protein